MKLLKIFSNPGSIKAAETKGILSVLTFRINCSYTLYRGDYLYLPWRYVETIDDSCIL